VRSEGEAEEAKPRRARPRISRGHSLSTGERVVQGPMGSRVPFSALMTGFLTHFTHHHRLSKYETENYERLSPENALSSISAGRRKELCCRHSRWSGEPRTHLGRQKTNLSGKVRLASRVCATTLSFLFAMLLPGLCCELQPRPTRRCTHLGIRKGLHLVHHLIC